MRNHITYIGQKAGFVCYKSDIIGTLSNFVCGIRIYNIDCAVMHLKGANNVVKKGPKTQKIQDGGMFTWKFKMAAIFLNCIRHRRSPDV